MLSEQQISEAIDQTPNLQSGNPISNRGVRAAYEWLDAQRPIKSPSTIVRPLKHIIEKWAGFYVSQSDVKIAATLHPAFEGMYPRYNIAAELTRPSADRLGKIGSEDAVDRWLRWPEAGEGYKYSKSEGN